MPHPGIPEKAIKSLSAKKGGTRRKITKQDLAKRIGGLITSQPIMFMGT
jgi:hypothetical protein